MLEGEGLTVSLADAGQLLDDLAGLGVQGLWLNVLEAGLAPFGRLLNIDLFAHLASILGIDLLHLRDLAHNKVVVVLGRSRVRLPASCDEVGSNLLEGGFDEENTPPPIWAPVDKSMVTEEHQMTLNSLRLGPVRRQLCIASVGDSMLVHIKKRLLHILDNLLGEVICLEAENLGCVCREGLLDVLLTVYLNEQTMELITLVIKI